MPTTDADLLPPGQGPPLYSARRISSSASYRSDGAPGDHGRLAEEIRYFLELGVDGFFTDFPYVGVTARASASSAPANRR